MFSCRYSKPLGTSSAIDPVLRIRLPALALISHGFNPTNGRQDGISASPTYSRPPRNAPEWMPITGLVLYTNQRKHADLYTSYVVLYAALIPVWIYDCAAIE